MWIKELQVVDTTYLFILVYSFILNEPKLRKSVIIFDGPQILNCSS